MVEAQPLSEIGKKTNQSKRRQEIRHLLAPWVLKDAGIHVQVPHDDRAPPWKEVELLLRIQKAINSWNGEVLSNERVHVCAGNDFASHHIRPVEANGLGNTSLWTLPHDQARQYIPLDSPS